MVYEMLSDTISTATSYHKGLSFKRISQLCWQRIVVAFLRHIR